MDFRHKLLDIGAEIDRQDSANTEERSAPWYEPEDSTSLRGDVTLPHILIDLNGMIVVHKPPDWEVDGKARAQSKQVSSDAAPALSAWLRTSVPRTRCPVAWQADVDFGILHRLDVPSSGLVLCGTTFLGLMMLRWQLDTYRVERQYIVWGHGLAAADFCEVLANIDPTTIDSKRSFVSEIGCGKPAKTSFKVSSHATVLSRRSLEQEARDICTGFVIRIKTGRRHQIRAHLLHRGNPTAVDAKYGVDSVEFVVLASFEQAYMRAGCPD
eukprot:gnl/TRDRNA2_/TRDRNA2_117622_c0_seq1.p1 gnl/TRDRNA2_/TRDRNA2_117622_c0~~gnl/TRDRNA2_/TRDRNA2_117622_c0_seq1.p1  ORF type:complete len:269 (-),score=31.87 gnl/TRDRNA2_/TRDRNA2_117622_c0_seq1:46-852(-)